MVIRIKKTDQPDDNKGHNLIKLSELFIELTRETLTELINADFSPFNHFRRNYTHNEPLVLLSLIDSLCIALENTFFKRYSIIMTHKEKHFIEKPFDRLYTVINYDDSRIKQSSRVSINKNTTRDLIINSQEFIEFLNSVKKDSKVNEELLVQKLSERIAEFFVLELTVDPIGYSIQELLLNYGNDEYYATRLVEAIENRAIGIDDQLIIRLLPSIEAFNKEFFIKELTPRLIGTKLSINEQSELTKSIPMMTPEGTPKDYYQLCLYCDYQNGLRSKTIEKSLYELPEEYFCDCVCLIIDYCKGESYYNKDYCESRITELLKSTRIHKVNWLGIVEQLLEEDGFFKELIEQ